jgi:hypothetical protein
VHCLSYLGTVHPYISHHKTLTLFFYNHRRPVRRVPPGVGVPRLGWVGHGRAPRRVLSSRGRGVYLWRLPAGARVAVHVRSEHAGVEYAVVRTADEGHRGTYFPPDSFRLCDCPYQTDTFFFILSVLRAGYRPLRERYVPAFPKSRLHVCQYKTDTSFRVSQGSA